MYTLMFFKQPFSEKLAQINGSFKIPSSSKFLPEFHDLMSLMLQRDPSVRVGTGEIWSIVDSIRDKIIKERYTSVQLPEQRGMAKSATTMHIGILRDPQSILLSKPPPKPPTVPIMAPQEQKV
jgi:hypothetical protein